MTTRKNEITMSELDKMEYEAADEHDFAEAVEEAEARKAAETEEV